MTFLCDTNIISELSRPQPNPGVLAWSTQVSSISLSVITVEEIAYGLASKPNTRVQNWFEQFLKTYCQIIPFIALCTRMRYTLVCVAAALMLPLHKPSHKAVPHEVAIPITAEIAQFSGEL